ncbi:MAG: thiamine pyrophosphate-dependent enzyme [bacterium]
MSIARAYGCHAERVEDHAALRNALIRAQDRNGPSVIEVPESDFLNNSQ